MTIRLRVAGIYYDETFELGEVQAQLGRIVLPDRTPPTLDLVGAPAAADAVTILELMEAARVKKAQHNQAGFTYAFDRRFKKIESPAGTFTNTGFLSMIAIGHQLKTPILSSLGGKKREVGFYKLTEIQIPNGVVAWQNYIIRDGRPISSLDRVNPSPPEDRQKGTFTTFDQAILKDKDTVVWRMVAIRLSADPVPEMGMAA
jgi:hypothetical protein